MAPHRYSESALLHRAGSAARWGSLGLWDGATDYAQACEALARAVGQAAQIGTGDAVLSLACGAGDELELWLRAFAAGAVIGIEIDPAQLRIAQQRAQASAGRITVQAGSALELGHLAIASIDRVVCVDAAYHLSPRPQWAAAVRRVLRTGGRLAYTDLTLPQAPGPMLQSAASHCGVDAAELRSPAATVQMLQAAGYTDVQVQLLDDRVLAGFARFVWRQSRLLGRDAFRAGWRRPLATAVLIKACAAAGYALFSAAAAA